jgi:hypothetical protein
VILFTRHGGAWGERRYSSYSFLTSAQDWGEWSASRLGRSLPPGKAPAAPSVQEAGWASEPVWTYRLEEKSYASVGDLTPFIHSVVRHYTDWATPAPYKVVVATKNTNILQIQTNSNLTKTWLICRKLNDFSSHLIFKIKQKCNKINAIWI